MILDITLRFLTLLVVNMNSQGSLRQESQKDHRSLMMCQLHPSRLCNHELNQVDPLNPNSQLMARIGPEEGALKHHEIR